MPEKTIKKESRLNFAVIYWKLWPFWWDCKHSPRSTAQEKINNCTQEERKRREERGRVGGGVDIPKKKLQSLIILHKGFLHSMIYISTNTNEKISSLWGCVREFNLFWICENMQLMSFYKCGRKLYYQGRVAASYFLAQLCSARSDL